MRKITPELTSATNPPPFAEEDWPWAHICAHIPLLYIWDACHSMAWWVVCRSTPGIQTCEPQAAKAECANLTTTLPAWLHVILFLLYTVIIQEIVKVGKVFSPWIYHFWCSFFFCTDPNFHLISFSLFLKDFNISCPTALLVKTSLDFLCLKTVLILPSLFKAIFTVYRILSW